MSLNRMPASQERPVSIAALKRGDETYIVKFFDEQCSLALRSIGLWAASAELSFTWSDAAVLARKIGAGA